MRNPAQVYLRYIAVGVILSVVALSALIIINGHSTLLAEVFFYETLPGYSPDNRLAAIFRLNSDEVPVFAEETNEVAMEAYGPDSPNQTQAPVYRDSGSGALIGLSSVIFQPEEISDQAPAEENHANLTLADIGSMRELSYLQEHFYTVDKTVMTQEYFNVDAFLADNLKISPSGVAPKVLICHTHSQEAFSDSEPGNADDTVVGLGSRLAEYLLNQYGIVSLHLTGQYDVVNGVENRLGAYERIEPDIRKVLEQYPSIEVVIDLHRDGIPDSSPKLETTVDGKPTAKIMFFNGLCMLNENGSAEPYSLQNPYLKDNLAFSFNMQLKANEMYPGLTRKIYLKPYRYSLFQCPKSLLVEVGAQNNTKEEARNAMEPLAKVLASVILP